MNLIKTLNSLPTPITEEAAGGAVGAGAIATTTMPLFQTMVKRNISHPRIIKFANSPKPKKNKKPKLGIREKFHMMEDLSPDRTNANFDASEVIAKLKSLEDKESVDYKDTVTFGLVDTNGNIVKVTIPKDQSSGFEQDIQHFMGEYEESDQTPEIAEILFNLKNHYTIVNVEWPDVEEDQEDSASTLKLGGDEGEDLPGDGDLPPGEEGGMPGEEGMPGGELPAEGGASTDSVTSLLTQVIDMMKTDADARKAEAQAREAEFKTRQAVAARDQAMARVKQEEQMLDMEEYNKSKKEREKEAKRLAQLAKWKHDVSTGKTEERPAQEPSYDFLPGEESEEYARLGSYSQEEEEVRGYPSYPKPKQAFPTQRGVKEMRGKVSPADIAKFITSRVK